MDRKLSAGIQVLQLIETFVFVLLKIRIQHSRSDDGSPEPHNIAPLYFSYNPEQAYNEKLYEAVWTTSHTSKGGHCIYRQNTVSRERAHVADPSP